MIRFSFKLFIALCFTYVVFVALSSTSSAQDTCEAACVKIQNGQMRCVAPDTTCLPSEQLMLLGGGGGGQGPQGEPGEPGEPGEQGPPGPSDDVIGGGTDKVKNNAIRYIGMFKDQNDQQTEPQILQVMPIDGAVTDFNIITSGSNTVANTFYRVFLRKESADTPVNCDVVTSTNGCMDVLHCEDYEAGNTISVRSCPSSLAGCGADPVTVNPTNDLRMNWTALFHAGMTCADLGFE